jgi:L-ascorbate metabolism protein UlaG (beta-lactamase superfamily)
LTRLSLAAVLACAGEGAPAPQATSARLPEPAAPAAVASPTGVLEVRYLANEGFLIEGAGKRVLIDALFGSGIPGYAAAGPAVRSELEASSGEWSGVRVALATHHHGDHFDPAAVERFLAASPEAVFVSTPQARARMAEADESLLDRFVAVLPAAGEVERLEVGGVTIHALNLHHGVRDPPVENLGFVISLGDQRVLHFGDTEAKMDDFEPYLELLADTDLALLPFWFLSSEWRAEMVRDRIRPRWVVAAHTPLPTAPATHFGRWNSYESLVRSMSEAFPDAMIPRESGETWTFDPRD